MGMVFNIQRFSVHDGPGIRTTVFFSGCNLRCLWCHNPESHELTPRLGYFENACTHCGKCVRVCPAGAIAYGDSRLVFDRERCENCFACVDYCAPGARRISGKPMTAAEVIDIIIRDKPYYDKSGGGVTFSGGEPLLQPDFLMELLQRLRKSGINTAIESALCVPENIIRDIAPLTGLFMCDIKSMDDKIHKKYTGISNKKILANIALLSELGADVLIRVPVINGVNADETNIRQMAEFLLNQTHIRRIELLELHTLAAHKYKSLGLQDTLSGFNAAGAAELHNIHEYLTRKGLTVI